MTLTPEQAAEALELEPEEVLKRLDRLKTEMLEQEQAVFAMIMDAYALVQRGVVALERIAAALEKPRQ